MSVSRLTLSAMDSDDGRYVTCCHEAGHVKACELRGVRVGRVHVDTEYGRVDFEDGSGVGYAFIAYAGPWAEARLRWTEVAIDDNTLDEDGRRFADHVAEAFSWNESDWVKYETEIGGDVSAVVEASAADMFGWDFVWPTLTPPDAAWSVELDARWPEIQQLAARMLRVMRSWSSARTSR
jgi:hypothetical protein